MKSDNSYVFCKREDAMRALDKLEALIRDYGKASAADLYDILGIPSDFEDTNIGWSTTAGFVIERYHDGNFGWVLKYPAPKTFEAVTKPESLKTALNRIYGKGTMKFDAPAKTDMVNHPSHYQSDNGLEVIDVIEAFTKELKGAEAFCVANAIKYLCRFNKKNGVEDLEKAKWYIERAIKYRKKHERKSNKTGAVSYASYAEADAKNTADMYRKIMRDDDFGGEVMSVVKAPNKTSTSDVEVITNVVELERYTAAIKEFENRHLLVSFKTKGEGCVFMDTLYASIDKCSGFTVRNLATMCFDFSEEIAADVTNHYGGSDDRVLWCNSNEVVIDDVYTHEDGSVTLSIEYPTIHTNKED